jgi:hypothetical protein
MVYKAMTTQSRFLGELSDEDLLAAVRSLACGERNATAELVAHLAELDARRLYLGLGFASLFAYCIGPLRLSEHAAYHRIEAARAARRFPVLLDRLREGSVNLTTVLLLAPHLTDGNHAELLAAASGKRRREVEELLARRFPSAPVPPSVRKLPDVRPRLEMAETVVASTAPATQSPSRRAVVVPSAPEEYRVTFTASAETCRKLREAQNLLRHQIPDGDPARIFDQALSALLADLARKKLGATPRPAPGRGTAPGSRHVPAEVRRVVWSRDGGRCAFVSKGGHRCGERGFLEFHHRQPYALGGGATLGNISLRCRAHNDYEAQLDFAPREAVAARSRTSRRDRPYGVTRETTAAVFASPGGGTPHPG